MFPKRARLMSESENENENESKLRRSKRLSTLAKINSKGSQITGILKDRNGRPSAFGLSLQENKSFSHEDTSFDSATSSNNYGKRVALINNKPHSFNDLRFGGGDTLVSVEFAEDIDQYLRHMEKSVQIKSNFLKGKRVDERMRQILVDWLMEVQLHFKLCSETLHLTVFTLDRALTKMEVSKENLQLLGVTCLFIAAKYEEIYVPNIQDFVDIAVNQFAVKDVIHMEHLVLDALNFQLSCPYILQFLEKYRTRTSAGSATHDLANFIAEVALLDYSLAHLLPSKVAGVCVYLANIIQQVRTPLRMYRAMGMPERELVALAQKFAPAIQRWIGPETMLFSLKNKLEALYPNDKPPGLNNLHCFTELVTVFEECDE